MTQPNDCAPIGLFLLVTTRVMFIGYQADMRIEV